MKKIGSLFGCGLAFVFTGIILGCGQTGTVKRDPVKVYPTEDLTKGAELYRSSACGTCHGSTGKGISLEMPNLAEANGPLSKPSRELVERVWLGSPQQGKLAMPPKGGAANLSKEEIGQIVEFMKFEFLKKE